MENPENKALKFGRYLEDFNVGDKYFHFPHKTITESDNNIFSLITMNHHPVHIDAEYAKQSEHNKILVVGTLVFSLVVGMTVRDVSGKAIANLGYNEINHDGPVFINDTIKAKTTVMEIRESKSKNDRGIVKVLTEAYNQNDKKVLSFTRTVLIPKKNYYYEKKT